MQTGACPQSSMLGHCRRERKVHVEKRHSRGAFEDAMDPDFHPWSKVGIVLQHSTSLIWTGIFLLDRQTHLDNAKHEPLFVVCIWNMHDNYYCDFSSMQFVSYREFLAIFPKPFSDLLFLIGTKKMERINVR